MEIAWRGRPRSAASVYGPSDLERTSSAFVQAALSGALMGDGDCANHSQTQPGTAALARAREVSPLKRFEDCFLQGLGYSGPAILDRDHALAMIPSNPDAKRAGGGVATSILQESKCCLADARGVAISGRQRRVDRDREAAFSQ